MLDFPHHYAATAAGAAVGDVVVSADRLPVMRTASPAEFDGPGDQWSPETLLVGAVADCFILTFRAVARASRLSWISLQCQAKGTLDRVDRITQFTHVELHARLEVSCEASLEQARRALEKAERNCLISNSLKAAIHLKSDVSVGEPVTMAAGASSI